MHEVVVREVMSAVRMVTTISTMRFRLFLVDSFMVVLGLFPPPLPVGREQNVLLFGVRVTFFNG